MSHRVQRGLSDRLRRLIPFGLGQRKPKHFRNMAQIAWENRSNLPHAWRVLSRGVCDGCALGVSGFHDWTIDGVHLCSTRLNLLRLNTMGPLDPEMLADVAALRGMNNRRLRELGRLPYPMIRRHGEPGFTRIPWSEAIDTVAGQIKATDPDRLAFFMTSRGITNEVYYVAQKVARYLGTNNIDNAARLCHSPSTGAMKPALGVAATTCSYTDWFGTDLVVFFGANPANDQPVTTKYLHQAKKLGTKIISVNPYQEPGMQRYWVPSTVSSALFGTDLVDYWFNVANGGDIAFLYGVIKLLFDRDAINHAFVEASTADLDTLRDAVDALDWPTLEKHAGLPRASFEEFADLIAAADNAVFVWSMGITQHTFGADGVQMIINLGLLRGYIGRDKCGLMPIRGHSGVQGGAEMGAYSTAYPGGKPINADTAAALSETYGFDVPDQPGLQSVDMVEAAGRGELDLLYCLGGNFLRTLPEPDRVAEHMARVPMRVHQDIIVNDQMLIDPPPGGCVLLLPAKTRYEQEDGGTETTTERRVLFSPEIPRQVGEARAEWKILRELAQAVDPARMARFGCATGWEIRKEIAEVIPMYDGIQHLKKAGDQFQYGGPHLCAGGKFPTPDGKARFMAVDLPDNVLGDEEYYVTTRRGKQFNTLIYGERDPITGADRDAILISDADADALGLHEGQRITLVNDTGRYTGHVFVAPITRRSLQVHWPEGNVIIPRGRCDRLGGVPDYNARVRIEL